MNKDYLAEQFDLIGQYVERARSIAARGEAEFLADPILVDAATRELTVLFETTRVDDRIVFQILSSEVGDFESFAAQVIRWIQPNEGEAQSGDLV